MKKITILGDIMVEPPFLKQVSCNGTWDFKPSFSPLKKILEDSDYVIGNLETPLAGEAAGYTERIVSFNAPDCLLDALTEIGMNAVCTANNHCLDRGYEGLARTLEALDRYGIAHTGTYATDHKGSRIHYFSVGETRVALISYTFSTNATINGQLLNENTKDCVNLLHPQFGAPGFYRPLPPAYGDTIAYMQELLGRKLIWEETIKLKIAMHLPVPIIDNVVDEQIQDDCFKNVERDYYEARKNADLVFFCPHSGGQFNEEPGQYTIRLVDKCVALGFDGVFTAHSHTTQRAEIKNGVPCFYSIGNVSMSADTFYSVPECLPTYGLAVHLYVDENKVSKVTFSVIKMVEDPGIPMRIVPVDLLYQELDEAARNTLAEEVAVVCSRVMGKPMQPGIPCCEYELLS